MKTNISSLPNHRGIQNIVAPVFLCLVTLAVATGARGQPPAAFTYTSLDYPGAVLTAAEGINPQGDIAGLYIDANGVQHGFVLSKGAFRSVDYPGAASTDARGINPSGEVVGNYRLPGEPPAYAIHGFRLAPDGTFSPIDFPGWTYMIAQRILPDGTVLGCIHDAKYVHMIGFVVSSAGDSSFDVPQSMHNGATPGLSQIAGLYFDMTLQRGRAYIVRDGSFNPFDFPGSVATSAWDMNPSGAVVGAYTDGAGAGHGFLMQDGQFTSIDFPGAHTTAARGVNPRGDIVGWYVGSDKHEHAFVGSPER
jgi:uncharacterized membrane protein